IVFGGPSTSNFADHLLAYGDAVLKGRGEVTLPLWLTAVAQNTDPTVIPGIITKCSGKLFRNAQPVPTADAPTRYDLVEGFGPRTRRDGLFGMPKEAVYSLFASTGCVRHCRFCITDRVWNHRSHDSVTRDLEQVLHLHQHRGTARFMLVDDCLFGNLDWTKELLRRIAHTCQGHDVSFSTQFHVQPTADDELMRLFREARFTSLALGFETTSQTTLNHERKGTTTTQNDQAIEQCRRFGIVPYGYFVVGFDSDDELTVRDVFQYIYDRRLMAQVLPVGLMSRDEDGNPTPDAGRILSETSFGATVFVSHRPARLSASQLQMLINRGYQRISSLRRLGHFSTAYERRFLIGLNRCLAIWHPLMQHHVTWLQNHGV
ncbi:MAG TPA: radical SAM protein, partial [Candidatus Ozemobacteraceae bacterium]|nr:radical SAM protein [Candidatus Ozemobacteraceae bacterium]